MQYKILQSWEVEKLEQEVNDFLSKWWKLQWWVCVYPIISTNYQTDNPYSDTYFAQSIIKE